MSPIRIFPPEYVKRKSDFFFSFKITANSWLTVFSAIIIYPVGGHGNRIFIWVDEFHIESLTLTILIVSNSNTKI